MLALALMVIALTLMTDTFFTVDNSMNVLRQICVNLCLSIGMTMIILSGGIDLSVGSMLALSGAVSAGLLKNGMEIRGTDVFVEEFETVYESLEAISFDYGVMERTKEPVYVLPSECGWSDVGSWASLYELRGQDHDKNRNLSKGDSVLVDCEGSFVSSQSGRLIACLGLENCLIVDTPEALLVADLKRSQDIREIVKKLKDAKRDDII